MTRTRWTAACAAVLLLAGGAAQAQESSCHPGDCRNSPCRPQTAEAARAPYYYELPQMLFPAQCSNPANWARLFEAVAKCRAEACKASVSEGARDKARRESRDRRMAFELLKLYRLFYREGHYKAAEIVADRALSLDPTNPAAEHALAMARIAAGAIDRAASGDAEDCTEGADKDSVNNALPAPRCGMCLPTPGAAKHGCKGAAAKTSCACGAECCCDTDKSACKCGESCACSKSCACGADCCCDKDKSACKCGDSCACKKSERQNVHRRHRERTRLMTVPPWMAMPPGAMMPPCPMGLPCPGMMPGPAAMMPPGMPMPPNPWMPPPPNMVMSWPAQPGWHCNPAEWNPGLVQYKPGFPEPLPMPREVLPARLPQGALTVSTVARRSPPAVQMCVSGKQIQIISPCLEAYCDSVNSLADGRVLLDGDVTVIFHVVGRPAKIVAPRMIVDLEDGSYEVNPSAAAPLFRPVGFLDDPFSVIKKAGDCRPEKPMRSNVLYPTCPAPTPATSSGDIFWHSGSGLEIRY